MTNTVQKTLIRGARCIDPHTGLDQISDIAIDNGRIAAIGPNLAFAADTVLEATGCVACPGLIDLAAGLHQPNAEPETTVNNETRAAALAGITLLCLQPLQGGGSDNSKAEDIKESTTIPTGANVVALGPLTQQLDGQHLSEIGTLKQRGCVGVSNALHPIANTQILRRAMEYVATHDLTLHVIAMDKYLSQHGVAHDGKIASRLGLPAIPVAAETVALAQYLALIEDVGVKTHFGRISSAQGVAMIAAAKDKGLPITADVAVHHLHLTETAIDGFNSYAHVIPPLRSDKDRAALRTGIQSGVIDAICSDHQPHSADAKLKPYPATEPGISGLDTLLGLCLSLTEPLDMQLPKLLQTVTIAPASILGVDRGRLAVNAVADLCLFNPEQTWTVTAAKLNSTGKNSPFIGTTLPGRIIQTFVQGQAVLAL